MKIGEGGGCQNLSAIYNHNKTQLHEMPQLRVGLSVDQGPINLRSKALLKCWTLLMESRLNLSLNNWFLKLE